MSDKPDYEKAFKMLLAANYMGVRLSTSDGHWWIETEEYEVRSVQQEDSMAITKNHEAYFDKMLVLNRVDCRSKVYDGPLQALARIDAAMKACGSKGLIDGVYTDDWYMGDATESNEGVTKNGKEIA